MKKMNCCARSRFPYLAIKKCGGDVPWGISGNVKWRYAQKVAPDVLTAQGNLYYRDLMTLILKCQK